MPETAARPRRDRRACRTRCSPRSSSARCEAGRGVASSAAPSCCRCCARPASSTPAATALHDHLRRRRRGAARRRAAAARAPRAGARHPPRSTSPRPTATARTSRSPAPSSSDAPLRRARSRSSATRCSSSATATTLKVHVHTDDPERATGAVRRRRRTVSHLDVADMHEQVARARRAPGAAQRRRRPPARACGALAVVVAGTGMRALFEGLGRAHARRRPDAEPVAPTTCWPASTRSRPRRSSCCPTART